MGRGAQAAECLLVTAAVADPRPEPAGGARRRLDVVAATTDGFKIAEADLELRGCGDLFGVKQAGMPSLRFADLAGMGRLLTWHGMNPPDLERRVRLDLPEQPAAAQGG